MSERPQSPRRVVQLLIAVAVLGFVFGGGVLLGWATREHGPAVTEKSAEPLPDAEVKEEIAACRRELKALSKARSTPPAMAAPPGETDDAGLERAAKIEALQKEVEECRVGETLVNAYVCGSIGDHINLLSVLLYSSSCVGEVGVEEFFVRSLAKCAEFEDFPAHLDEDKLTQAEKDRVVQSIWRRAAAVSNKNYMDDHVQELRRRCRRRWALPDE
jgi:hypothetical protein